MRSICIVEDCEAVTKGHGYCSRHYYRLRRHGTLNIECEGQSRPGEHNGMYGTHRNGEANPFFGKNHTEEAKERMRQANLGRKHTAEENQRNSARLKGRDVYWLRGKSMPEKQKAKLRLSVPRGDKSPHWRGGVTPMKVLIRKSPAHREWARKVKERDNFTCVLCGERGGVLHSDHILPFYLYPDLCFDLDNGRTLCVPCHTGLETSRRPREEVRV